MPVAAVRAVQHAVLDDEHRLLALAAATAQRYVLYLLSDGAEGRFEAVDALLRAVDPLGQFLFRQGLDKWLT